MKNNHGRISDSSVIVSAEMVSYKSVIHFSEQLSCMFDMLLKIESDSVDVYYSIIAAKLSYNRVPQCEYPFLV